MVGVALLGTGIFAREAHLPGIKASPNLTLKAIYSRSQASAESFATRCTTAGIPSVSIYFDTPTGTGKSEGTSLTDLLARSDIDAVIVCLPIVTQPDIIKQALAAGKHVFSEKPAAKDMATARELVAWHANLNSQAGDGGKNLIWAVAENFRFLKALACATEKLRSVGGTLTTFTVKMYSFMKQDNKFYHTEWRKVPEHQGGFVFDGGVHAMAAIRALLAATNDEISQVCGFTSLLEEYLPPIDTVHAVASTKGGRNGTLGLSWGTEFRSGLEIEILTTNGSVLWDPKQVKVVTKSAVGEKVEDVTAFEYDNGVAAEMEAFGQSIIAGKIDPKQTPEEALKDLEIMEAMLQSNGALVKIE